MIRPGEILRRVSELFRTNLAYKLLSVLIALALWFIVRDERVDEAVTVSLEIQSLSPDLVLSGDPPEVTVGVTGTRVALDRLKGSPVSHTVKVKASEPGVVTIRVRPEEISFPSGVEAYRVTPSAVKVELERRVPPPVKSLLDAPRSDNSTPSKWRTP